MSDTISKAKVGHWLKEAEPGQKLHYFQGFLASATDSVGQALPESERQVVACIANRLWRARLSIITAEAVMSSITMNRNCPAPIAHHSARVTSRPNTWIGPPGTIVLTTISNMTNALAVISLRTIGMVRKFFTTGHQ